MANVDLLFFQAPHETLPVELVFGDEGGAVVIDPVYAEVLESLNLPTFSAVAEYDNRVQRYMGINVTAPHEVSLGTSLSTRAPHSVAPPVALDSVSVWESADGVSHSASVVNSMPGTADLSSVVEYGLSNGVSKSTHVVAQVADRVELSHTPVQSIAIPVSRGTRVAAEVAEILPGVSVSVQSGVANPLGLWFVNPYGPAHGVSNTSTAGLVPWGTSVYPYPGKTPHPGTIGPEEPIPYVGDTTLLFQCPAYVQGVPVILIFGGSCDIYVPPVIYQKVHRIMNSMQMIRVSDSMPIAVDSANVSLDKASWGWKITAQIHISQLPKVEPSETGPVEVEFTLNGVVWRFDIESYTQKNVFSKTTVSIEGRSLTARLDSSAVQPRSHSYTTGLTTSQMADQEITRVGAPLGYSLDWTLVDALGWPVPADTFSFSNLTPMAVVKVLAESVQGYVSSHRSLKQVQVRSAYPLLPWEWAAATPDFIMPSSLVKGRSLAWAEKPLYTGVYVSGGFNGEAGIVRRDGTDGSIRAQDYVNDLITHPSAVLEYGRAILGGSGRQANILLETPMHPDLSAILPGALIEHTDPVETAWRGLVRAVSLNASWQDGLTITQAVEVERHY